MSREDRDQTATAGYATSGYEQPEPAQPDAEPDETHDRKREEDGNADHQETKDAGQ